MEKFVPRVGPNLCHLSRRGNVICRHASRRCRDGRHSRISARAHRYRGNGHASREGGGASRQGRHKAGILRRSVRRRSCRGGHFGRHLSCLVGEDVRRIVKARRLYGLCPFQWVFPNFLRGFVGIVICFNDVEANYLRGRAKGTVVPVNDAFVNVTFLSRFRVNGVFRLRCFTVIHETSCGFTGLFKDGRAPFVLRNVLMDFVKILARQSNDQLGILFNGCKNRVAQGRFMLHRRVKFRPCARTVFTARGRRVACSESARGFEFRISASVIKGGDFVMEVIQARRERRLRSANLPLKDDGSRLNRFHQGLTYDLKGAVLCICYHRIEINALFRVGDGKGHANVNNQENRMDRVFRAVGYFFRQEGRALLRDLYTNAGVANARRGNKEDGVKVLFSKRHRRSSSPSGSGHCESSDQ